MAETRAGNIEATEQLFQLVYEALYRLARQKMAGERNGHILSATALVHETYLRLVDKEEQQDWDTRSHFFAAAAEAMRRILIDHARQNNRIRRGGDWNRIDLDIAMICDCQDESNPNISALDAALTVFAEENPQPAQLVRLRYFGGLNMSQIAKMLGISLRTGHRQLAVAKTRLHELIIEMENANEDPPALGK